MDILKIINIFSGKKKNGIAMLLILLMAGFGIFKKVQYDGRIENLQREIIAKDSLVTLSETVYQKKFMETKDPQITDQELQEMLDAQESAIRLWSQINGIYDDALITGKSISTQLNGVSVDSMSGSDRGIAIEGWQGYGKFSIAVKRQPLKMDVVSSQDKTGIWRTTVNTNDPYLTISRINSEIYPYGEIWKKKFFMSVGGGMYARDGKFHNPHMTVNIGAGYGDYELSCWVSAFEYGVFLKKIFRF